MKLSLIIGLCICFFSCTSKQVEERTVQSFGETGKLTPEICHLPSPIYIPRYMGVTGDYLYVYKERENKKFVVFKLPEMKYLGEMGSIGQGPNDFNLLDFQNNKNRKLWNLQRANINDQTFFFISLIIINRNEFSDFCIF